MLIEFQIRKKLDGIIEQIDHLLLSDFPHESSQSALNLFRVFFEESKLRVTRAVQTGNRKILMRACATVNERILQNLPLLGFLLRSTHVRNNFESYDALLEISKALVGADSKVVLSSEWDYSPLTYPMNVSVLPGYVLLGMPASEAGNALILPLAGHELGHSVWAANHIDRLFAGSIQTATQNYIKTHWPELISAFPEHTHVKPDIDELSRNLFLVDIVAEIGNLAISQLEEIFCDAVGAKLFSYSFAFAFHYLLAPSLGGARSLFYPKLHERASFLVRFGGVDLTAKGFSNYAEDFEESDPALSLKEKFVSQAADETARGLAEHAYTTAEAIVDAKAKAHLPTATGAEEILVMFRKGIPAVITHPHF